ILDFISMEEAKANFDVNKQERGFRKIAWAFLKVDPCIRSMMALQEERGSTSYSELQNEVTKRSLNQPLESKPQVLRWSRLPGQVVAALTPGSHRTRKRRRSEAPILWLPSTPMLNRSAEHTGG
ncbi:unnamed protein product, partial [Pleuronectes platessa]